MGDRQIVMIYRTIREKIRSIPGPTTEPSMDQLRTLVIDDSRAVREFVVDYVLKPHGFHVDVATDGAEGLYKAINDSPDLILMDFEMPKMTGLEVLRSLREEYDNQVPVILMTSHGSEQVAVEVFRLGVQDYIMKPFAPQDMLDAIDRALSVTRLQREKEELTRRVIQANQQLKQYVAELNALYEVSKSITALIQPNQLLERIVDAVLAVTQCDECSLVLVDPASGKVKGHLSKRQDDSRNNSRRTRTETRQLTPGILKRAAAPKELSERVLSVPLKVGKRVFGTLSISKRLSDDFTRHHDRLLRMLADYAAIAIHNMQLIHQLHLTKEREKQQIRGLFERYVSPSVVQQMLTQPSRVSLGGSRQTVTVLFADVRGFSAFSSRTSPEILVELLNKYLRAAADAVMAQEGTVDKFMGDAVMAFFNAPLTQADHPARAVRAAWALRQSVKQLHQSLPDQYRLNFGIGVGIGEAVVGNIGTAQMMNYTIIGDAVNKVKRLQENAKGGQILISQETYHLVHDYVEAQCVGSLTLKGQSQPEPVYEVLTLR